MSASSLGGNDVRNRKNEDLGKIEDIMLDTEYSRVAYAVLSFGTFLGMGGKYFAIPWESLELDTTNKCFILDVDKKVLENAPGFDDDNWPDMADRRWGKTVYDHYNQPTYWAAA